MLANWLNGVLLGIVSENQSAFVPGILINDNIVIGYKIMHYIHKKGDGKMGVGVLKINMAMAYDRVKWNYVEAMMCGLCGEMDWVGDVVYQDS